MQFNLMFVNFFDRFSIRFERALLAHIHMSIYTYIHKCIQMSVSEANLATYFSEKTRSFQNSIG